MTPKSSNIANQIVGGQLTNEELNDIIMAVKLARQSLAHTMKRALDVGDNVQWSGRAGKMYGTIMKINSKTAHVKSNLGPWKVPMNMLSIVEG